MMGRPAQILRRWWSPLARRAALAYVAGPTFDDAMRACRHARRAGVASAVGFWDPPDETPEGVARTYLSAVDTLGREALDCYLSVKAPSLGFSLELWLEIVERARSKGTRVHFDALGPESVGRTFDLIETGLARHPRLGCTLPGRWRRSLSDANRAVELGLAVRIVKGEFPDQDGAEIDPRQGFLAVVDRLAGRARFVGVATHDAALVRLALERLLSTGTPCEAELLFGLPSGDPSRVARGKGVATRLYVPFGQGALPYRLSQARQRPEVLWWAMRDLVRARATAAASVDMGSAWTMTAERR